MAAGRWDAETSALSVVLAALFARRGRQVPANPFRPAVRPRVEVGDPAEAAAVARDVKWRMFAEGMKEHARKVARFKAAQQPQGV